MAIYQILIPIASLLLILKAGSHYLRGEKTIREFIGWIFFWGSLGIIALFPTITEYIALILGIKNNVNALIFSLLGALMYIVFKLIIHVERQEQELTKLTRALSMKEFQQQQKKSPEA